MRMRNELHVWVYGRSCIFWGLCFLFSHARIGLLIEPGRETEKLIIVHLGRVVFFSLFLVRVRKQNQCGRAKGKKQTKKKTASHPMAAHVPSKWTESRHSTCNRKTVARYPERTQLCSSEESSQWLSDSETRSTAQACAAADLLWSRIIECMETYSADLHDQLFFFFTTLRNQCARSTRNKGKKTTWP